MRRKGFASILSGPIDTATKRGDGLQLRLAPGASLTVRASDSRGRPGRRVVVVLLAPDGGIGFAQTDEAGVVRVTDLASGRWTVADKGPELDQLLRGRHHHIGLEEFPPLFRALPGAVTLAVAVGAPAEATLVGPVRVAVAGTVRFGVRNPARRYLKFEREGYDDVWLACGNDGRFRIDSIETGRYQVYRPREDDDGPGWVELGMIEIPSEDRECLEIDASK